MHGYFPCRRRVIVSYGQADSMTASRYWTFSIVFWVIAALLMFVNALRIDHWDQVLIRFIYFPILGVLLTAAKTLIYQSDAFRRLPHWAGIVLVLVMSGIAAVMIASVLNPITYLLLGLDLIERHYELMSTGLLYFGLLFLLWSLLFFQLDGRPLLGQPGLHRSDYIGRIGADDGGQVITLAVEDVVYIAASGDYVEIHMADKRFLKKETIANFEALLDPELFRRVHRSTMVNVQRVSRIEPKGGGAYALILANGQVLNSSRSYRAVIKALQASM